MSLENVLSSENSFRTLLLNVSASDYLATVSGKSLQ